MTFELIAIVLIFTAGIVIGVTITKINEMKKIKKLLEDKSYEIDPRSFNFGWDDGYAYGRQSKEQELALEDVKFRGIIRRLAE